MSHGRRLVVAASLCTTVVVGAAWATPALAAGAPSTTTTTTTTSPASDSTTGPSPASTSITTPSPSTTTRTTTTSTSTSTSTSTTTTAHAGGAEPTRSTEAPAAAAGSVAAYWLVASDGGIFSFGGAKFYGSTGSIHLNKPVVGMARTATSQGYWLVASDGGIFSYGDAFFWGSTGSIHLNQPVVGMAANPAGGGYWLTASDGGIFSFGSARFYGSMGGHPLNQPVVGMAATPDGHGYWLVAKDGGIFAFGDARFYGSTGSIHLNRPIVSMTTSPGGAGYWFTAADGGVFAYGDAPFYGSLGGVPESRPITAMTATPDGKGYWFTNNNGAVTAYGDAGYWGSAPQVLNQPIVGMTETEASGQFYGGLFPAGALGYDISNYQCNQLPPSPHTIGIVEVAGASMGAVNPCLGQEAGWAAGGLNLYVYLTYGTTATAWDPACNGDQACNFGFAAAVDAYRKAVGAGINAAVAWWLDIEADPSWTANLAENAALVRGAIDGLRSVGLNNVGIYASPGSYNGIVGDYQPPVPYWAASWQVDPSATCRQVRAQFPEARLPTGPVEVVQFSAPPYPLELGGLDTNFDDDYAC